MLCPGLVRAEKFHFEFRPEYAATTLETYGKFARSNGGDEGKTEVLSADVWMSRGEWEEAGRLLERTVKRSGADPYFRASAWERLGLCRLYQKRWKEASDALEEARRLAPPVLKAEIIFCQAATAFAAGQGAALEAYLKEVTGTTSASVDGGADSSRMKLPRSLAHWRVGDFEGALAALDGAAESGPVLYMKGLCRLGLKRPVEALADFQRAGREYPGTPWANRARFESGETYYAQGDLGLAARAFEEGARLGGRERWGAFSSYRLACIDLKKGEWGKAEKRLDRLATDEELTRVAPVIPLLRMECLRRRGNTAGATVVAQRWSETDPSVPEAQFSRLWMLAESGDWKTAIGWADRLSSEKMMANRVGDILLVRGYCLDRLERSHEAVEAYRTVAREYRGSAAGMRGLESAARLLYRMGRYDEIVTSVNEEWAAVPADARARRPETGYWIAEGSLAMERWSMASEFFGTFTREGGATHGLAPRAYQGWAEALLALLDFAGAESRMRSALELADEKGAKSLGDSLTFTLAQIYFNGGDYGRAVDHYKRFIERAPLSAEKPEAMVQEGMALARNGDGAAARTLWETLMTAYPASEAATTARFRLGQSYLRGGEYEKGAAAYEGYLAAGDQRFSAIAQFDLGQCRLGAARYGESAVAFGEFLSRYPNHPLAGRANDLRQASMLKSGRSPEEVEKATQGSAKSMALADGYWERGAAAFNGGRYAEAIADFDKILSDFATSILVEDAGFYRAESLNRAKRYGEAAAAFKMFRANFAKSRYRTFAVLHEAECLYEAGDFGAAGDAFQSYAAEYAGVSDAGGALLNAGLCYFKARRFEDSARVYGDYLAGHADAKDAAEISLRRGEALEKAGRSRDAMAAYRGVPKDAPERVTAVISAASLARAGRDEKEERRILTELLSPSEVPADPQRINGLLRLGEILLAQKDWAAAKGVYEAVAQDASDPAVKEAAKVQAASLAEVQP